MESVSATQVERAEAGQDTYSNSNELHGRAIQQQEHNRGYLETLRNDPWLLVWIGVMLWSLIVRGFELQASGSVLGIPDFQRRFGTLHDGGQYYIDTNWQSALTGGSSAAAIVGAWAASHFADIIGIKPVVRQCLRSFHPFDIFFLF
jgi:hypothetical protein